MPPAISPASAMVALVTWIQSNHRAPTAAECRKENGLNHYKTYCILWGGLSNAVSAALLVASSLASGSLPPGYRTGSRPCMRCGRLIRKDRRNCIHHCSACRRLLFSTGDEESSGEIPLEIRKALWDESWDDLLDEAVILPH